jgi:hypothetical protein
MEPFTIFQNYNNRHWISFVGGQNMSNVHEYHRNAAECFCLAQETSSTETKELLLYMAEEWRKLADKAGVRSLDWRKVHATPPSANSAQSTKEHLG